MIIDYRNNIYPPGESRDEPLRSAFVNGKEIRLCWYADTVAGIAKTYDVFGDGRAHLPKDRIDSMWDVEDLGGILSKTLRGTVEIRTRS